MNVTSAPCQSSLRSRAGGGRTSPWPRPGRSTPACIPGAAAGVRVELHRGVPEAARVPDLRRGLPEDGGAEILHAEMPHGSSSRFQVLPPPAWAAVDDNVRKRGEEPLLRSRLGADLHLRQPIRRTSGLLLAGGYLLWRSLLTPGSSTVTVRRSVPMPGGDRREAKGGSLRRRGDVVQD